MANGIVDLGRINDNVPSGYEVISILPTIPNTVDTTIFNNKLEYMVFSGKMYVSTYKAATNVKLDFICICEKI